MYIRDKQYTMEALPRTRKSYFSGLSDRPLTLAVGIVLGGWYIIQHVVTPLFGVGAGSTQWLHTFGVSEQSLRFGFPLLIATVSHFTFTHFIVNFAWILVITSYLETRIRWEWMFALLFLGGTVPILVFMTVESLTGSARISMGSSGAVYTVFTFVCLQIRSLKVPFEPRARAIIRSYLWLLPVAIGGMSVVIWLAQVDPKTAHLSHIIGLLLGWIFWFAYTRRGVSGGIERL